MEPKSNKIIVLEFYKHVVGERNSTLIDTYVSDHYIQHSPALPSGKAGLLEALEMLKQFPKPKEQKSPIIHALEDDDYVMIHLDFEFNGIRKNVIDFFRLENGKVAEHWDAVQDLPEGLTAQCHSYKTDSSSRNKELTENNKSLIQQFFHEDAQTQKRLSSEGHKAHNSEALQPLGTLKAHFSYSTRSAIKVHRVLGENNFVVVQSEGIKATKSFVFYDLFNVLDNRIVEHWGVEQEIPAIMPHGNGMI